MFVYYLPSEVGLRADTWSTLGISSLMGMDELARRQVSVGPDGGHGLVVALNTIDPNRIGYWPEKQTWEKCDNGQWWMGRENGIAIAPADLFRPSASTIRGWPVTLQGHDWVIPAANPNLSKPMLPARRGYSENGERTWHVLPQYEDYQSQVGRLWEKLVAVGGNIGQFQTDVDDDESWSVAEAALSVCYRLSGREINALGLLDTTTVGAVVTSAMDLTSVVQVCEAWAKTEEQSREKKTDVTSNLKPQLVDDGLSIAVGATA